MQSREQLLARMLGSDPTADGQFVVAVLTTGIYCLPTCRPSRKPRPENVTFYATPAEARAAGFRACKLCKPDDFYAGRHAEEELIEGLVARINHGPGAYADVGALATAAGIGTSKLHQLCRDHYQTTPATLLTQARVAKARTALLAGDERIATIAFAVGYESLSAFNENFRKLTATTPLEYRQLRERGSFTLHLPPDYPCARILRYLGRERQSVTARVEERVLTTVLSLGDSSSPAAALVRVTFLPGAAHCQVIQADALDSCQIERLHDQLLRTLGLAGDPARFEAQIGATASLAPLIAGQQGLRVPQVADPFDALTWAIVGQQITLAFAFTLRRRLIERIGTSFGAGLHAPPRAEAVAALEPGELTALGFSRAKADYLIGAARAIVGGRLPLAQLADKSATRIERALLATRGLGPWSAHYLLMRHFGFLDCIPVGDVVLAASLQRFFALEARPDKREMLTLMEQFRPYRSLATFHLWQRHGTAA